MEVRGNQGPGDGRLDGKRPERRGEVIENMEITKDSRQGDVAAARERANRAQETAVERVRELQHRRDAAGARAAEVQEAARDRLDLSPAALIFSDNEAEGAARAALVDQLKAAYERGNLNTRERIERAAEQLLGGE